MLASALPVFAYGTLKQGFHNHAAYCRGALDVVRAEVWGRLYVWEPGIPILAVPDETILLTGTRHLAGDLTAAQAMAVEPARLRKPAGRGWRRIQGEILYFPDPEARMRLLDAFEGVHPRPSAKTYERVLLPTRLHEEREGLGASEAAWAYVLPPFADEPEQSIDADAWRPGTA